MSLGRSTEMGVEEVVATKGNESPLLLPDMAQHQWLDRSSQIVIAEPMRHASKEVEGTHMPVEEGFLLLSRKSHEAFFYGHVCAFDFFGGVPHRLSYDNLTAAV